MYGPDPAGRVGRSVQGDIGWRKDQLAISPYPGFLGKYFGDKKEYP